MSWLLLAHDALYLMQGGSQKYIDRARIQPSLIESSESPPKGSISEFPYEWFLSAKQRPKTMVLAPCIESSTIDTFASFTDHSLLRRFITPTSYELFESLSKAASLKDLISTFESEVGTNFSDEFQEFRLNGNALTVSSTIRFATSFDITSFPANPINPNDRDSDKTEPSFLSTFLEVLLVHGYTIKPYITNDPFNKDFIAYDLRVVPIGTIVSPQRVSEEYLERAVYPKIFNPSRRNTIGELISDLSQDRGILVTAEASLLGKDASFMSFVGQYSLSSVLDIISTAYSLNWDWQGGSAIILYQ